MNREIEKSKEYLYRTFKRYHMTERCSEPIVGFYVNIHRKGYRDEIVSFLKKHGCVFYLYRENREKYENEQKIYLANATEGFEIEFAIHHFESFEELKTVADSLDDYLKPFLLETKFFNESFLKGEGAAKGHEKVVELYEKAKMTESYIEEKEERKVFAQLDTFGKFNWGMRDSKHYHQPYGTTKYDVDVKDDVILVEKIHFRKYGDYANKQCDKTETEIEYVKLPDGSYTSVFTEKSARELEQYFRPHIYHVGEVYYDFIKTSENKRRLQKIYLKNLERNNYLVISTDARWADKGEISPYLTLEFVNELELF